MVQPSYSLPLDIVLFGYTTPEDSDGGFVAKMTSSGSVSWLKTLTNSDKTELEIYGGVVGPDGYYAVGYSYPTSEGDNYDTVVIKVSTSGSLLWQQKYGGDSDEGLYGINSFGVCC